MRTRAEQRDFGGERPVVAGATTAAAAVAAAAAAASAAAPPDTPALINSPETHAADTAVQDGFSYADSSEGTFVLCCTKKRNDNKKTIAISQQEVRSPTISGKNINLSLIHI